MGATVIIYHPGADRFPPCSHLLLQNRSETVYFFLLLPSWPFISGPLRFLSHHLDNLKLIPSHEITSRSGMLFIIQIPLHDTVNLEYYMSLFSQAMKCISFIMHCHVFSVGCSFIFGQCLWDHCIGTTIPKRSSSAR